MPNIQCFILTLLLSHGFLVANTKILFLGDSLTEGYGIEKQAAYPTQLQKIIEKDTGIRVEIINGGVNGSTTASGISRIKWYKRANPDIVILALGANDGLRGIPIQETEKNLQQIIDHLRKWGCRIVICGMKMPPNYGESYRKPYESLFPKLAENNNTLLVPFLLEGVAGEKTMNLPDGIHPNEEGHQFIASNIYKVIKDIL